MAASFSDFVELIGCLLQRGPPRCGPGESPIAEPQVEGPLLQHVHDLPLVEHCGVEAVRPQQVVTNLRHLATRGERVHAEYPWRLALANKRPLETQGVLALSHRHVLFHPGLQGWAPPHPRAAAAAPFSNGRMACSRAASAASPAALAAPTGTTACRAPAAAAVLLWPTDPGTMLATSASIRVGEAAVRRPGGGLRSGARAVLCRWFWQTSSMCHGWPNYVLHAHDVEPLGLVLHVRGRRPRRRPRALRPRRGPRALLLRSGDHQNRLHGWEPVSPPPVRRHLRRHYGHQRFLIHRFGHDREGLRLRRWSLGLWCCHGPLLLILVHALPALVKEVGQLHMHARIVVAVRPAAKAVPHEADVEAALIAVRQNLLRTADVICLKTQPQRQSCSEARVVAAERRCPDQPESPLVGDIVVGYVDAVHGEGLRLGVKVLDERVHNGVIQHVPVGLHNDTRDPVVSQYAEELV
mmetsp:Transcript_86043/g.244099  ORF Transcript_86043/g.244099 Transcript_86043/m.244099 type:complete len:467 (+) Transcript_86043:137-1537(+)